MSGKSISDDSDTDLRSQQRRRTSSSSSASKHPKTGNKHKKLMDSESGMCECVCQMHLFVPRSPDTHSLLCTIMQCRWKASSSSVNR